MSTIRSRMLWVLPMVGMLVLGCWASVVSAVDGNLKWRDEVFTTTFVDADVQDVLSDIITRNGQNPFFLKGVQGAVTFDFGEARMLLRVAFDKLMKEHELTFSYNPNDETVTISLADETVVVNEIFTPKFSLPAQIKLALLRTSIDFSNVKVKVDDEINSIFFNGVKGRVKEMIRIAEKIDRALGSQDERSHDGLTKELDLLKSKTAQRLEDAKARQEELLLQHALEASDVMVKVIPLRFANVDTSKTTFQGEEVTLPGILDSLQAFVGSVKVIEPGKEGAKQKEEKTNTNTNPLLPGEKKPVVSVDVRTNSIIVQGTPAQVERIEEVIKKLDQPMPLVEIEVMIVDGVVDVTRQLGIQWGYNGNYGKNAGLLDPASNVVSDLTMTTSQASSVTKDITDPTTGVTTQVTTTSTTETDPTEVGTYQLASNGLGLGAGFLFKGTRYLLDSTLDTLAKDDKLQTIASPRVVTINNISANITNSTNINFVVTTGDGTKSDIQTVSTGISLKITPSVIRKDKTFTNGLIRLAINATNSTPGSTGSSSVTTNDQQIQTNVIIPDGATFVMGGLFNTTRVEVDTGVPVLKDVPILGALFGSSTSQDQKRETLFFITPKVYAINQIDPNQGASSKAFMEDQRVLLRVDRDSLQTESQLLKLSHGHVAEDE